MFSPSRLVYYFPVIIKSSIPGMVPGHGNLWLYFPNSRQAPIFGSCAPLLRRYVTKGKIQYKSIQSDDGRQCKPAKII